MKILMGILGAMFLLVACQNSGQQKQASYYNTLVTDTASCVLYSNYTATISGKQYVDIRPQVSGVITDICINEGAHVKKGQLLFVIDQVPYKAALETAEANVKTARAKLETVKLTAESKQALYDRQVVSLFDLQTARNSLAEAEAELAQAKAQEINARNDLSYTEIRSPVDGVASMIPYRVGALVSSTITEPLVSVADDSEIYAYFSLTETQILDLMQLYGSLEQALRNMPAVGFKLSNGKMYPHEGRIDAISGTVDASTGAVVLRAVFPNPEGWLRNGGNGTVILPTSRQGVIIIPQAATYEIQNKTFVYKVVGGYTQSTEIDVFKLNDGQNYIVESGLEVGDTLIAEGAGLLRDSVWVKTNQE